MKVYLEKIGLDEVVVTQRSSDGGIDFEAVRYGIGGFAGADAVDYFVQAKRNKPGTTIPIEKVRALRGVMLWKVTVYLLRLQVIRRRQKNLWMQTHHVR